MKCTSKCKAPSKKKSKTACGHIDTEALDVLIRSKTPLVILDARMAQWDDGKRIPGARLLTAEATAKQAAKFIPSKRSLVVVYCSNPHCPASGYLADQLSEFGYTNLLKYEEGIEGWVKSKKPVKKARK
jgi:rhodanese-related sulfurtransferase